MTLHSQSQYVIMAAKGPARRTSTAWLAGEYSDLRQGRMLRAGADAAELTGGLACDTRDHLLTRLSKAVVYPAIYAQEGNSLCRQMKCCI
ncbi:hypothetical protein [Thermogemmatispora carboxidivorans]|uniref:hypothetical protein n=1 Tax=Thermogemmatispora carboxidivorans TaxID=1382306 RepID=UPI0012DF0183|nr:hypothetical protein [Thermogemmatispora carboxidivorans]